MERIFYHGTLETNAISIISDQKFDFSEGDKHLLGKGIYLYEDLNHAVVWAKLKGKYRKCKASVLEVLINFDEDLFMDLDLREEQDIFFSNRNKYIQNMQLNILNSSQYTDSKFCDYFREYIIRDIDLLAKTFIYINKRENNIPYRHTNEKETDENITRHYRTEKQFCLKDNSWIKRISITEQYNHLQIYP